MKKVILVLLTCTTFLALGQNTDIRPDLLSFPTKTTAGMNALTIADGLRQGSTVYNTDLKTLAFLDGCKWQKVKRCPPHANYHKLSYAYGVATYTGSPVRLDTFRGDDNNSIQSAEVYQSWRLGNNNHVDCTS
jgi:hypothetical protein